MERTKGVDRKSDTAAGVAVPLRHLGRGPVRYVLDKRADTILLRDHRELYDMSGGTLIHTLTSPVSVIASDACSLILPASGYDTARRLALEVAVLDLAGQQYDSCLWASSGSDAVELALWAVAASRRVDLFDLAYVVREGGYHGATALTRMLSSRSKSRSGRSPIEVARVRDTCERKGWARSIISGVQASKSARPQLLLIEPVATTGNCFWPGAPELAELSVWCRQNNVLLVLDEVASGVYRHGWFTVAQLDERIRPDAIVLAKGLTTGIVPLSCCLIRGDIADTIRAYGYRPPGFTVALNDVAASVALDRLEQLQSFVRSPENTIRTELVTSAAAHLRSLGGSIAIESTGTTIRVRTQSAGLAAHISEEVAAADLLVYSAQSEALSGAPSHSFVICPAFDCTADVICKKMKAFSEAVVRALGRTKKDV